ncbi:MAG: protein-disulfide reductase DsbD family protein [Hyphomonadaceae bacterium]|nr:protein-disulfide reductase DsbD family protein [Hyphomonadaceae bacterium]
MRLTLLLAVFAALILGAPLARAEPFSTERVEVELHSARAAIAPGESFTIVLRQKIIEGWHTYWVNPGDSGEATDISWTLPEGFQTGEMQWPAPEAIPFDILMNYGYSGEVLYPIQITAPANARIGENVTLIAALYWLVCSDVCIPEEGTVSLTLPVAAQGADDPQWAPRIAEALAAIPQPNASIQAHITEGTPARLSITLPDAASVRDAHFFPYSRDAIDHAAPQAASSGAQGVSFVLRPGAANNLGDGPLEGVVTLTRENGEHVAFEITAQPGPVLPDTGGAPLQSAPAVEPMAWTAVLAAIGFAFLGGLILNIMPCVLPVLSMKALSFAGGAHSGEARTHGLLYALGVLATFLALAVLLLVLRSAGEAVGWGFQLQMPLVTAGLALLFFAIGLNLLGVFEIAGGVQNLGAGAAQRGGALGAFFTGALAVVAATPCTAPFMASAIGAALTQSALVMLLIFAGLAIGFAAPMVALAFAPGLQRAIPKPGPWMEQVKHVLAFPMFGAAIWLGYVLTQQGGAMAVAALLGVATALAFALMASRWGRIWFGVGAVVLALTLVWAWPPITTQRAPAEQSAEAWSPARVEALRAEGRGVFVNFTAAWCVTCQLNDAVAISRPAVVQAFADDNIAYLEADWTNRNEEIATTLAQYGRAGVPLYLYYPPGEEPVVLPQVLSEDLILETIMGDAS